MAAIFLNITKNLQRLIFTDDLIMLCIIGFAGIFMVEFRSVLRENIAYTAKG